MGSPGDTKTPCIVNVNSTSQHVDNSGKSGRLAALQPLLEPDAKSRIFEGVGARERSVKALLGILGGCALTLAIFASGLAVAISLLAAKPVRQTVLNVDAAQLWTVEPRRVNVGAQDIERLPARPVPQDAIASSEPRGAVTNAAMSATASGSVDTTVTTSLQPAASDEQQRAASGGVTAAHVEWCANRYRSYRPGDNSYTPYGGGRRPCISPYTDADPAAAGRIPPLPPEADRGFEDRDDPSSVLLQYVSTDADANDQLSSEHVRHCFSRYHSYRPDDNTYQPYSGGQRRQCQ